jgi:hypothetical protein
MYSNATHGNTVQMTLFADGRIQFGYKIFGTSGTEVGLFPADSKKATQRRVDFDASPSLIQAAGDATFENFEDFLPPPKLHPFDLDAASLLYTPLAAGGYEVHVVHATSSCTAPE